MIAQKLYSNTAIGAVGTMTYGGVVSVGAGVPDQESGYQRFATQIAELETMEINGLVRIDFRHHESSTGKRNIDLVRFTRLK